MSRRTGSHTRPRRAFFFWYMLVARKRRGLSNFAQTRARTRRVLLCPRPTALYCINYCIEKVVRAPYAGVSWPRDVKKCIAVCRLAGRMAADKWLGHVYHQEPLLIVFSIHIRVLYWTGLSDYGYWTEIFFWYQIIGISNRYRIVLANSRNYRTIRYRIKTSIYRTIGYQTRKKLSVAHVVLLINACLILSQFLARD